MDRGNLGPQGGPLVSAEIAEAYQPYLKKLYSCELEQVLEGINDIKNLVIGNNKRKSSFILLGTAQRLIHLVQGPDFPVSIKIQAAVVLGSLAKGIQTNVQNLLDESIIQTMCCCLITENLAFYEAAIRCLRTVLRFAEDALPRCTSVVSLILQNINRSVCTQICTCEILQLYCQSPDHQSYLLKLDILTALVNLLEASTDAVTVAALILLSTVCYKNDEACKKCQIVHAKQSGKTISEVLIGLLAQRKPNSIRLYAARCLSYMFRVNVLSTASWTGVIAQKVVPCLVYMCGAGCLFQEKVCAAETIAYLTEVDQPLQRLTYICEQYPKKLENYLKHPMTSSNITAKKTMGSGGDCRYGEKLINAGLLGYASLLSNDEDIRKQVASESLVGVVCDSISSVSQATRAAALKCLLSLSRSIHLLRTTIQDSGVWRTIFKLVNETSCDMEEKKLLSSILCNMTLDVSPSKTEFCSVDLISRLIEWINVDELKLNAIWCLMNMSFQAQPLLKLDILNKMEFGRIQTLATDGDSIVILRTLGLLRNLCHNAGDELLSRHGTGILLTCKHVLTTFATAGAGDPVISAHYECIRAHTVCILSCLAGITGQSFWQETTGFEFDCLPQVIEFLGHFHADLQLAAVTFLYNFISTQSNETSIRHSILSKGGALAGLRQLHSTNDAALYEKVESTLQLLHNIQWINS